MRKLLITESGISQTKCERKFILEVPDSFTEEDVEAALHKGKLLEDLLQEADIGWEHEEVWAPDDADGHEVEELAEGVRFMGSPEPPTIRWPSSDNSAEGEQD